MQTKSKGGGGGAKAPLTPEINSVCSCTKRCKLHWSTRVLLMLDLVPVSTASHNEMTIQILFRFSIPDINNSFHSYLMYYLSMVELC